MTFQRTVVPEGAPLAVNCRVPPTATLPVVGASVSVMFGVGTVLTWK